MFSPPQGGAGMASPGGPPMAGRAPAGGVVRPGAAGMAYPQGGGGDVDQPLSEKFQQLAIAGHGGPGTQGLPPEILPRPRPDELANGLRWEARGEGDPDTTQCHPRFMRLTLNTIPATAAAKQKAGLPFGAVIRPLARADEVPVPLVNFGMSGVVRCRRCRTYINPFVSFVDGGRRWRCNVCSLVNDGECHAAATTASIATASSTAASSTTALTSTPPPPQSPTSTSASSTRTGCAATASNGPSSRWAPSNSWRPPSTWCGRRSRPSSLSSVT